MRILFVSDAVRSYGGVESYVVSLMRGLRARGHELALLHHRRGEPMPVPDLEDVPRFGVADLGLGGAIAAAGRWGPDVCFAQNVGALEMEDGALRLGPVVKVIHGYVGTCVSQLKMHSFPRREPCTRVAGPACLALYLPRRCGERDLRKLPGRYLWTRQQAELLRRYAAVVVTSENMRREYLAHGVESDRLHLAPLFATNETVAAPSSSSDAVRPPIQKLLFVGRMTPAKGGDLLLRAAALASKRLGRSLKTVMVGDGPERPEWERLGARLGIDVDFSGWLSGPALESEIASSTVLVVPSTWPEPFGLVGLEAGSLGVPAVAFDVGGISEWLKDGRNGYLVPARPPAARPLAEAIVRILSDPARLDLLRQGARSVAAELNVGRHLDAVVAVFQRVGAGAERAPPGSP